MLKLRFEPDLDFQLQARGAVCDLFRGQEICRTEFTVTRDRLGPQHRPASCKTFLPDHAFAPQITGYSGHIGVRIKFTAGEVKG